MRILEVFFDYACPFCLRGHTMLLELLPSFPDIEVRWCPCEAHPRPESYGKHSDLCIQGMFFAQAQGADLDEYHARMYRAAIKDRVDIEDIGVLAGCVSDILDAKAFAAALRAGTYAEALRRSNAHAYQEEGVWAVPSYRMEGKKLDAVENIGVHKKQLEAFLRG